MTNLEQRSAAMVNFLKEFAKVMGQTPSPNAHLLHGKALTTEVMVGAILQLLMEKQIITEDEFTDRFLKNLKTLQDSITKGHIKPVAP